MIVNLDKKWKGVGEEGQIICLKDYEGQYKTTGWFKLQGMILVNSSPGVHFF